MIMCSRRQSEELVIHTITTNHTSITTVHSKVTILCKEIVHVVHGQWKDERKQVSKEKMRENLNKSWYNQELWANSTQEEKDTSGHAYVYNKCVV